jgi:hypothetical protein
VETSTVDLGPQPPKANEAEAAILAPQDESEGFDAYRSIVSLLVGLALIGGDGLIARLRTWETAHPPEPTDTSAEEETESAGDLVWHALIGVAIDAPRAVSRAASASAGALSTALRPLADNFLVRSLWAPVRAMATRTAISVHQYAHIGRIAEQRSRELAGEVLGLLMEDTMDYVGETPAAKSLVQAQVEALLPALVTDPTIQQILAEQLSVWIDGLATRPETLDLLVRQVGDRYVAYLNEHPDEVQNLVQGQAVGMATDMRDSLQAMTVTGDTFLEKVARGVLRRTPRQDLPPPPPEVQRRAQRGRLRAGRARGGKGTI